MGADLDENTDRKASRRWLLLSVLAALFSSSLLSAQIPNDFDGDGLSDLVLLSGQGTSVYSWRVLSTTDAEVLLNRSFGGGTDLPVPANWEEGISNLAVARLDTEKNEIAWRVLLESGTLGLKNFGRAGDVILSGGDFDGSGAADVAVVRDKGSRFRWLVKPNLMAAGSTETKKVTLGRLGDRVFFASVDGETDWAGVFGPAANRRSRLRLRNVFSQELWSSSRFPGRLSSGQRPRPYPLRSEEGMDHLFFVTTDGRDTTTIAVYTLKGRRIARTVFDGLGTFAGGEYDLDAPGDEILFQSGSGLVLWNPIENWSTQLSVQTGTLTGGIQIGRIGEPAQ